MKDQQQKSHEQQLEDDMEVAKGTADFKNAAKKKFCRFTMFVKLWPGVISHWPLLQRVWCHKGDRFTHVESKQIAKLVKHAKNNIHLYAIIELYDNTYSHDNENRMILEYKEGVVVKNNLAKYQQSLKGFPLPEQFKT